MTQRVFPQLPHDPKVLVVDDNDINCLVAGNFCEVFGCTVQVANSGAEAITACTEAAFDAILMDVRMPGMSGTEAARTIRRLPLAAGVPIIALTGDGEMSDADLADTGIVAVLLKPITMHALFEVVRDALATADGSGIAAAA